MSGSMTALISAFARAYHAKQEGIKIFDDWAAQALLGEDYQTIAGHMKQMAEFFGGTQETDALDWVVSQKLAPLPLARAGFCEESLKREICLGASQYVIMAAGYDSFVWRRPAWAEKLRVFVLDRQEVLEDRRTRALKAGLSAKGICEEIPADYSQVGWTDRLKENPFFSIGEKSVVSMLGLSFYLDHDKMKRLLGSLSGMLGEGSCLIFDYLDIGGSEDMRMQGMLARASGELMHEGYDYDALESMLGECGFLIYEHLTPEEQEYQIIGRYNRAHKGMKMHAMPGVNLCMAVRKG